MRKSAAGLLFVVTLLVVPATSSFARGGRFGGRGAGHASGGGFHGGGGLRGGGGFRGGGGWHEGWHEGWHGGWHGGVIIGGPWWWDPWWWGLGYPYPYVYYPPPSFAYLPAEEPSEYIERQPSSEAQPQGYWYYCASAKAYYPTVETCPEDWIKVPPAPQ